MKILIIMDPGILVPPKGYGGHERLVEMFAKEYLAQGHEVHLLVTTGSEVPGCTIHPYGKEVFPPSASDIRHALLYAWKFLWKHRNSFDLVHNFGRLAYLLPILYSPVKKIMTYGREINKMNIRAIHSLKGKNIVFTTCSANLLARMGVIGNWEVVYNAIKFNKYTLRSTVREDAPLMFLGRIERIKGCHTAIKIAKETGNKLIIAGNISPLEEEIRYFKQEIEPFIDGKKICFVGPVNDEQKNLYLGEAKAILFPIEWNEPFGIVMIESMACGTPVIAFKKGSVDEVIEEGITGYKVDSYEGMIDAVKKIGRIDRKVCRSHAEKRFDASIIATQYLNITDKSRKRIIIVTTGQPAANPRVVKEYEAFTQKGYHIKVLYTYSAAWSYNIDLEKFASGKLKNQDFVLVGGNPFDKKVTYLLSRILFKVFNKLSGILPLNFIKEMSIARSTYYLWLTANHYRADIFIAHYLGALPAAVRASKKQHSVLIFDAEDYHRGEEPYYPGQIRQVIEMENRLLPAVNYITTASPLITKAYKKLYPGITSITINNVSSRKYLQPVHENKYEKLKLFWFSQYVGPKRGLENIIEALNITNDSNISLHILGNIKDHAYVQSLVKQFKFPANIHFIKPVPPDEVFKVAAKFDVGIAAEIPYCENRNICLTNKIFTYLMAGNCVLASNTAAQTNFMEQYPDVGLLYEFDNANNLSAQIKQLQTNRYFLNECKLKASELAANSINWEKESETLISLVENTFN